MGARPRRREGRFRAQVEALGGQVPTDQPVVHLPDGTDVPARFTGVLREEADGDWRVVQIHFSFGVGNEESFGELPT